MKWMKSKAKHIDFNNGYYVDFKIDEDDDITIHLHQKNCILDTVHQTSSETYLKSYFLRYGFDAELIWDELQIFTKYAKSS